MLDLSRRRLTRVATIATGAVAALTSTACEEPEASSAGASVAVTVAPLALGLVDDACYDLRVSTALGTVWSAGDPLATRAGWSQPGRDAAVPADATTLCASRYGAVGGISYVGPCDASEEADTSLSRPGTQNTVTLWVDGLYDAIGLDLGDWRDPCPPTGCTLEVDCEPNRDTRAPFDLTIMREARQGFFDLIVNFDDIFCSAKLDTCRDGVPIALLPADGGGRARTGVFGLACSAGTDAVATNLLYGLVELDCGAAGSALIDPSLAPGVHDLSLGGVTVTYGIYRGLEALPCGGGGPGSCRKVYWNLAVDLDALAALGATCTVSLAATANDGGAGFELGLPTAPGLAWPYVLAAATLTTAPAPPATASVVACEAHPLDSPGSGVATVYHGAVVGRTPPAMCWQYDGAVSVTGAIDGCVAGEPPCESFDDRATHCDGAWLDAVTEGYNQGLVDSAAGCVASVVVPCCQGDTCYVGDGCGAQCSELDAAFAEGYRAAWAETCPGC